MTSEGECPTISGKILGRNVSALLDTGSVVTCVSDGLYNELRRDEQVHELPVANVSVVTAVGRKTTPINKQILVVLEIEGIRVETVFFGSS